MASRKPGAFHQVKWWEAPMLFGASVTSPQSLGNWGLPFLTDPIEYVSPAPASCRISDNGTSPKLINPGWHSSCISLQSWLRLLKIDSSGRKIQRQNFTSLRYPWILVIHKEETSLKAQDFWSMRLSWIETSLLQMELRSAKADDEFGYLCLMHWERGGR
jgi:hypothetical protein